jgi:hypothetical protein
VIRPQAPGPRLQASGPGPQPFLVTLFTAAALTFASAQSPPAEPIRGLSNSAALASTYDTILDADYAAVDSRLAEICAATPAWCDVLRAVALWWQINLDPADRQHDARFSGAVERAIAASEAWTAREPRRAEAWFARGAAYGARAQWRVERGARLAAARDGKHIKSALERALTLDPAMHDAKFGIGMYRYYADVAPAALRMLRWLLLLPGGDRKAGLNQMLEAREQGRVIQGEADYQLHLIYLWYENRAHDALALVRGLETRYPRNPLFPLIEANIHDVYFHDVKTSAAVLRALLTRADSGAVNAPALAARRARAALAALDARDRR